MDLFSLWPINFSGTITLLNKMSFSGTSLYSLPPERCKGTSREVITISGLSKEKKNILCLYAHQIFHFVLFPRLVK